MLTIHLFNDIISANKYLCNRGIMKLFTSFKFLATIAVFLLSLLVTPLSSVLAAGSLIANSSVETAESMDKPSNWTSNAWGNNTAFFTYVSDRSNSGVRSLAATLTNRVDGDAKWMHDAVSVSPNTSYTYSSFYHSDVATEIDLQYTDANGAVSYAYASYVPASSTWKQQTVTFVTPASARKVVVMHVLAANGSLQTDDFELAATTVAPPNTDGNLFANPSFETPNGSAPANWTNNTWGTNTTQFEYSANGRTGTKSTKVTMSAYTNGDAKWFAEPVNVTPGKSYEYKDYYKSSVITRVVVGFISPSGTYTYQELPTAPASASAWALYGGSFSAPATATKATVYHLLDKVGTLSVDDVYLAAATTPTALVPNGSLETAATATSPASWTGSAWGANTPTYNYVANGHTGTKSVKVTVQNYVDGDAKWVFNPINTLTPGKQYRFTAWYKTNAKSPKVVVMFVDAAGVTRFASMQAPLPPTGSNTTWQQYSDTFIVPTGTVSVSTFMFIAENAWLQTDDYSITSYQPTGFNQPLLSLTFDDGQEDNITTSLPILNQYGFKTTQCLATEFVANDPAAPARIREYYNSGHEICSHTVTHPQLTKVTTTQLTKELRDSKALLESIIGRTVPNFATPYGDYNSKVLTGIKQHYASHRTVDEGYNSKDNFDAYRVRVQNITPSVTAAQINAWIKQAQADRTWLVLVYHRVATDAGPYDTTPVLFQQHLEAIKNSGIQVKTYQDALTEIRSQL